MQIYLVRHSPPTDIDGLCYGRLNVSVEESTIIAAAKLIADQILQDMLKTAPIYCSPLNRCLILEQRLAAPKEPLPSDELIEMDFGVWQGLRWDDIPRDQIDAWAIKGLGLSPGWW